MTLSADPFSLESYQFELPPELIAQHPAEPRDASRLLTLDRSTGAVAHRRFAELPSLLREGDLIVANNTRVIPARLLGWRVGEGGARGVGKKGGKIEFLMLERRGPRAWEGLMRAAAKLKPGLRFAVPLGAADDAKVLLGEVVSRDPRTGAATVEFDEDPLSAGAGEMPLPPYIQQARAASGAPELEATDRERYQTVYAGHEASATGSAAAPTAGLHFTPQVMAALRARGVEWAELTLHVGLGTFRPVKVADIREHVMHEEAYSIPAETVERVTRARREGRRVIAIGTTTARALESAAAGEAGELRAGPGRTSIFIYPGGPARPRVVGGLITNFHLPGSTLLMLVCALAGREPVLRAYAEAVRARYRFFSYGDAMLIL